MKKIVSICLLSLVAVTGADAAPSYLQRNTDGSYNVRYDYTDKAKTGWYVGGRAEMAFLNWENEYSLNGVSIGADEYSFESVFGGNIFVGHTFKYFWRAEVEAGLIGQFSDKDQGIEFKMTVPYVIANGYYDFANGLYVGAGLGIALPKTELNNDFLVSGDRDERGVSPMGALMFGWSHKLDDNLVVDLRYRLSGFWGHEQSRVFGDGVTAGANDISGAELSNDIGFVLNNSISMGLRYEF